MLTSQTILDICAAHATEHPDDIFYLLADHAGMPGLHRELKATRFEWISLFEGTTQASALSVAPLLIRIGACSQRLRADGFLSWVCDRGVYSSSLMLMTSELSIGELAGRLRTRLDAKISEDMDVLLRFFDPRVFAQLMRTLSYEQRKIFLSPSSCWWYVDRCGDLQVVEAQFQNEDSGDSLLVLSAPQEHQLIDASEPDQVEEQLRMSVPHDLARIPLPERHKFILRQMAAGRDLRITSTRELALYCALALVYGAGFVSHPEWSSRLKLVRDGKHDLTSLVADLNDESEE